MRNMTECLQNKKRKRTVKRAVKRAVKMVDTKFREKVRRLKSQMLSIRSMKGLVTCCGHL